MIRRIIDLFRRPGSRFSSLVSTGEGVAPTITVAPVLVWTVEIGQSPTLTDPVYTGDPGTITWTLYRDGVADGTIVNVDKATAEAYAAVAADIGPDLHFEATVTNGSGSDSDVTNAEVFDDATYLPDTAIGVSTAGLTLADGDTTVDSWAATLGGVAVTLAAPTTSQRLAHSTGGVGGRPLATGDGTSAVLVSFSAINVGTDIEMGIVGSNSASMNRTLIALDNSSSYLWVSTGAWLRANALTINTASAGSIASPVHASGDAESGGQIRGRIGGSVNASAACGAGSFNAKIAVAARNTAGFNASAVALQAWYIGKLLTTDQRTHLRALLTYHTGVAC